MESSEPAEDVRHLRRCMNDLVSVLALPAVWSGSDPQRILTTSLDALLGMLSLDFVYARIGLETDNALFETIRTAPPYEAIHNPEEIRSFLNYRLNDDAHPWPAEIRVHLGGDEISTLSMHLGLEGEIGVVVAGSQRIDFPKQTERLLLSVAANQVTVALQQACLLIEQKRIANELEQRVAERTAGLAAANEDLRKENVERKRIEGRLLESEAKYRVVVETASDAVISMDEQGRIILANPATESVFGYSPVELVGKPMTVLMPESMKRLHEAGYSRYLQTGEPHLNWHGAEFVGRRANGEEFPIEVSFGEMATNGQRIFTGFIRDISEKKRAAEAVAKSRSELASVMRAASLGALTASIAHEVNQPLSGIVTNASTCLRMLDSNPPNVDGARETARRTIRDGNRASDVITRLRALFKRKTVIAEPVDLNEAAREVIVLSLTDLQRNNIILRQELADNLPMVIGDRIQLQQVIINLLRNASDAMITVEDRPRQVVIRTECDNGEHVRLTVQDTGIGFAPDAAGRLFESFYTTKDDGMGIGLSVSRSIVEAHHGRLWAALNDGTTGSSFVFSIPCGPTEQASQEQ